MVKIILEKEVVKILLPSMLAVLLFIVSQFCLTVPDVKNNLLTKKKEMISEVTQVAFSILNYYHGLEKDNILSREEAQKRAMLQIKALRYGKEQKDYFWINDTNPKMVMHPYRPELDGQDMSEFADPRGKHLFVEFVKTVEASESGYVDYLWQWKDNPYLIVPKKSFVKSFEPWNWIIGTGVYLKDVDEEIGILIKKIVSYSTLILLLVTLISLYIVRQGMHAAATRKNHEEQLRRHRDHLEALVKIRTKDLESANENLSEEVRVRKQIAEELRYQHAFLQNVIESIPYPFCVININDFSISMTNGASRKLARSDAQFCYTMLHNSDGPCRGTNQTCPLHQIKKQKKSVVVEHVHYTSDNDPLRFFELHCHPIFDQYGNVVQMIESAIDVTERRRVEKNLHLSEERYRKLIETAIDAIFVSDMETEKIIQVNKSAEKLLGIPSEEIIGQTQSQLLYPPDKSSEFSESFKKHCLNGQGILNGLSVRHSDGHHIPVEIGVSTAKWGERKVVHGIFRDITERKKLENNLCQAQKLEAVGTLAGGIAHDFNNILTAILGFSEMTHIELPDGSKAKNHLYKVIQASRRARDLVSQILTFSAFPHGREGKKSILLQNCVRDALKLLRSTIPTTIELKHNLDPECPPVIANFTQVQQVIFNLCTNAYHAMRDSGGVMQIDVYLQEVTEDLAAPLKVDSGKYAVLSVKDTGVGMDNETLSRIFDPYFTTKKIHEGTGLGLASVQGVVKSHNGGLRVQSEVGHGSCFEVYFPLSGHAPTQPCEEDDLDPSELPRICKTVLFVDDEQMLVQLGKMYLERVGCFVTACGNSLEAFEKFKNNPDFYDIVVSDQTMPGMTGLDLAKEIKEIRPDIPFIIATGYSDMINEKNAKAKGADEFLMKPLTLRKLLCTIEKVLP
ncbi:MAG: cache domain-containing protein [Desulfobulbaceae bacterium]|nr:cache domain-containing protein [Desulfobulbaceae bacterium]